MFRVLGSINALNERMNLNLTHHDVNWVYNLHHLKGQGYYLKSSYLEVRSIKCLPTSNKGLKEDFLIFSREWHDGLPCSTREGKPGGVIVTNLCILVYVSLLIFTISVFDKIFLHLNDSADKRATKPHLNLVNRGSLDRILRSEVYANEADSQLRAMHLILGDTPISTAFQASKCDKSQRSSASPYQCCLRRIHSSRGHSNTWRYTTYPSTFCGHPFSESALIPPHSWRRGRIRRIERRRRRKKSRGGHRFVRFLRRIWGIQPKLISRGYFGRNRYPEETSEEFDGVNRKSTRKRYTGEVHST